MFSGKNVKLGIAPIAWTNDDLPELGGENTFQQCVSEMALAGFTGIKETTVQPEKGTATLFGTKVSAMQTGVNVADGAITGTLKFIQGGIAPGVLSGDGNFLALKFVDNNNNSDSIKVGLVPSATGMGLVELDEDMNAVFKIAGEIEGVPQVLKVVTTVNGVSKTQIFDLSGLTLETE